jgi:hypothetical protein
MTRARRTRTARLISTVAIGAVAATGAVAVPEARAAVALPALTGDTTCRWGAAACTPPARELAGQFRRLRDHGEPFGYRMGPAPDVTNSRHWQGAQRLMPGAGRFLAVSRSGAGVSFVVTELASRDGTGQRWRSNRLGVTTALTAPPTTDRVVTVVRSDPGFDHSGGIQTAGRFLAVGLEEGARSRVAFWDMAAPATPRRTGTVEHATGVTGAGTVSLARLRGGRYLLVVGGTNANILDFYVSRAGTDLSAPAFDHAVTWREAQLRSEIRNDRRFGDYQNISLLSDAAGQLWLIGTHTSLPGGNGDDFADLHRLDADPQAGVRITKVAKRHLHCAIPDAFVPVGGRSVNFGGRQCNFDAAGGTYVTPEGGLLLYGVEHDNDGVGGSVKAEEFRPDPHRDTCDTPSQAWVELYDDAGFDGDRSVIIDFADRAARDYTNFDRVDGFEDRASAGTWCLPRGWRYRLYRDKRPCRSPVELTGTGRVVRDANFADAAGPVRRFGDAASCGAWVAP